jgi:hypothetical protein
MRFPSLFSSSPERAMQMRNSVGDHPGGIIRGPRTAGPVGWRRALWLALLVAASIAFSLGFACAVPLAAFGASAALIPSRRGAIMLIVAVWLANQVVGYAVLDYPWTANSFAWGAAMGAAAVLATMAARQAARRVAGQVRVEAASFAAAFIVYECASLAVAAALLGGTEDFAPMIVGRILALNLVAAIGLSVVNRLGARAGFVALPATARPAVTG